MSRCTQGYGVADEINDLPQIRTVFLSLMEVQHAAAETRILI